VAGRVEHPGGGAAVSLFFRPTPAEQRSISYQELWGSGGDVSLLGSGVEGRLALVPLFSAWRTIIDAVCSTPWYGYRRVPGGAPQRLDPQPNILTKPLLGTPFTWKQQAVVSLLSDGNAVGLITARDRFGYADQLYWADPADVSINDSEPRRPVFYWRGRELEPETFVHIPWITVPGKVRGLSPLKAFMVAFEMGAAAQQFGRDWLANGAVPSGHFKSSGYVDDADADRAKKRFRAAVAGRDVLVTGDDWSYTAIGVPADEARFIESLKLSSAQIASIYGLRPEDVGGEASGPSLEYKTIESDERRTASRVVRPWAVRLEEAVTALRPPDEYSLFDLDAHVRADLLTRMQGHQIALRTGLETQAEGRIAEGKPPLTPEQQQEWMDTYGRLPEPRPSDPITGGSRP
jgi:HK97 family phage portal protein